MTLQFISPAAHAMLDYASAAIQAIAPGLLGLDRQASRIHQAASAAVTGYSLLTDYSGGAYKAIPMNAHLAFDAAAGAGLLTAAFLKRRDRVALFTLAGMGALSLVAAFCTETPERARRRRRRMREERGETPMQRYARERVPQPAGASRSRPDDLNRRVVPPATIEAARI